jgi:tetratricopeptide (TPR) repeat protein
VAAADWRRAEGLVSKGLARQPLSWPLYIARGYADVSRGSVFQAVRDFRYAEFLEPKLAIVAFSEGAAWTPVNRALALAAWNETLIRSQPAEVRSYYRQMLDASSRDPQLHQATIRLGDKMPALGVVAVDPTNVDAKTLAILESEKSRLNVEELVALTRAEASSAAIGNDFETAYSRALMVMRRIASPKRSGQSEKLCRDALVLDPTDFGAAYNLCSILEEQERWKDALEILEPLTEQPDCPEYFRVMEARAYAGERKWSEAWNIVSSLMR